MHGVPHPRPRARQGRGAPRPLGPCPRRAQRGARRRGDRHSSRRSPSRSCAATWNASTGLRAAIAPERRRRRDVLRIAVGPAPPGRLHPRPHPARRLAFLVQSPRGAARPRQDRLRDLGDRLRRLGDRRRLGRRSTTRRAWPRSTRRSTRASRFFDTADVYGDGHSERLLARLRRERDEPFVVATKMGRRAPLDVRPSTRRRTSRPGSSAAARTSRSTRLDLVQLHCVHPDAYYRPDIFEALDDLVARGLIAHYGVSVERVEEALKAIEFPGVASVQIVFNAFRQRPAEHFLAEAQRRDVGVIARVPLASGLLTGKLRRDTELRRGRPPQLQPPRRGVRRRRDVLRRRLRDRARRSPRRCRSSSPRARHSRSSRSAGS